MSKFFLIFLLCLPFLAEAQTVIALRGDQSVHLPTSDEVEVWRDSARDATLERIIAAPPAFKPAPMPFNGGYTRDVHWFRLRLQRAGDAPKRWLLTVKPAYLDDIRLYAPAPGGGYAEQRAGGRVAAATRPLDKAYGSNAFTLDVPDGEPQVVYLRLQTVSCLSIVELSLAAPEAQAARLGFNNLLLGVITGALLAISINAVILWYWLRQTWCLWFLGYALGAALLFLARDGAAMRYGLTHWPALAAVLAPIGSCVFIGSGALFFIGFFDIRRHFPVFYRIFLGMAVLSGLALLSLFIDDAYVHWAPWLMLYSLLSMPCFLYVAWRVTRLNFSGGRFFFAGYLLNCLSSTSSLLAVNNVIPASMNAHSFSQWGVLIYLLFFQHSIYQRVRAVEQQQREADLRAQVAERLAASEMQRRQEQAMFLNIVAHELKTPLAVIDSAVQTLESQAQDGNPLIASRHDRIRRAVSNLNNLLENALSAERYDNAPLQPRFAPIALDRFLAETVRRIVSETRVCDIRIAPGCVCVADRTLIHLALSNLLVNALKYSPADSPLRLSAAPEMRAARPGVALSLDNRYAHPHPPDCARWFTKYYRQHEQPNIEGLGLGLYLVREIACAHQGRVDARAEPLGEVWLISLTLWLPHPETEIDT